MTSQRAALAALWATATLLVSGSSDAIGKSRTFLAGELTMSGDLPTTDTPSFTSTPAQPLKKGDTVAAMTSEDQAWSVSKHTVRIGTLEVAVPALGMVKCSDGNFRTVFPAVFKAKKDIKAGETLNVDGYSIESSRPVQAGEPISTIFVSSSYLSLEPSEAGKDPTQAKPWLTVFKEDTTPAARSSAIEAWRIVVDHIGK